MAFFETEERARLKRLKIEQAVKLAMQSRWAEAADLNRQLIDDYPKEVEAHNRLGKALMELGKYDEAREAYNHALRLEATNAIAHKNLQRLDTLIAEAVAAAVPTGPVDPSIFIAETGRSTVTSLVELASSEILAAMDAGDPVALDIEESTVVVRNMKSEVLGKLEPKLRLRLTRLVAMGNQYGGVVTAADEQSVRVIIRETYRDPAMGDRPSFPTTGEAFRGYTRESLVRYDLEDEEEEEEEAEEMEPEHEPQAELGPEALLVEEPVGVVVPQDEEEES